MEAGKRAEIAQKSHELAQSETLKRMVEQIDQHVLSGAPEYFYLHTEADFTLFCEVLGLDAIESTQVLGYEYSATATELHHVANDSYNFGGKISVEQLLAWLGDFGVNLEFPNNFDIKLAVSLDDETFVRIEHSLSETVGICAECDDSDDESVHYNFENGHGCEHVDDIVTVRNYASIHPRVEGVPFFPPEWW